MKIAVIDSGYNFDTINKNLYEGIRIQLSTDYDYILSKKDIYDKHGHGSIVMSILEKYLEKEDKIFSYKVLDENLNGHSLCLIKAIELALKEECKVINISIGTLSKKHLQNMRKIIKMALSKEVIIVAANSNENLKSYPANIKGVYGIFCTKSKNKVKGSNFFINYNFQKINNQEAEGNSFIAPHISGIIVKKLKIREQLVLEDILNELEKRLESWKD